MRGLLCVRIACVHDHTKEHALARAHTDQCGQRSYASRYTGSTRSCECAPFAGEYEVSPFRPVSAGQPGNLQEDHGVTWRRHNATRIAPLADPVVTPAGQSAKSAHSVA
jgi:hypothetical protein